MTAGSRGAPGMEPRARQVLPSFVERTTYGIKETTPYNKLFEDRIIFLGTPIDDTAANDVIAQLISLEGMDPDRPIALYINSPGGSLTSLMAVYDTMRFIRPDIETTCIGQAASAAAILLAAGTPGKRAALSGARIMLDQPAIDVSRGSHSDLEIQAREVQRLREQLEQILARHTGCTLAEVHHDIERDRFLTPQEAKEYGLIDEILTSRKPPGR